MSNDTTVEESFFVINGQVINWPTYQGKDTVNAVRINKVLPHITEDFKRLLEIDDKDKTRFKVDISFYMSFKPKAGDYLLISELYGAFICLSAEKFETCYHKTN
jgi:hypothetical protein